MMKNVSINLQEKGHHIEDIIHTLLDVLGMQWCEINSNTLNVKDIPILPNKLMM